MFETTQKSIWPEAGTSKLEQIIVDLIKSLGFKQCVLDNCLFVKNIDNDIYLISLYVDDILVAGSNLKEVTRIKRQFTEHYEMKDLGELNFLFGDENHANRRIY